jgi:hypothetical protein
VVGRTVTRTVAYDDLSDEERRVIAAADEARHEEQMRDPEFRRGWDRMADLIRRAGERDTAVERAERAEGLLRELVDHHGTWQNHGHGYGRLCPAGRAMELLASLSQPAGGFDEEEEPLEKIQTAFDAGTKGRTAP